ncbi:MAG: hypothetical protein GC160_05875 [Acidobacteria bacterium]|nr:hypothetical protein [Acidobacteriota bacterium]
MSAQNAKALAEMFLGDLGLEAALTLKVMRAAPAERCDYRPDPKSMSALELCRHITESDTFFLRGVLDGRWPPFEPAEPIGASTPQQVADHYQLHVLPLLDEVRTMPGERLDAELKLGDVFQMPAVMFLSFLLRHQVHHRGQLTTYLRPMGGKVPSIYGGSADEPFRAG